VSVAFFDLDRTLLDANSGGLWLRHEWRAGRVGVRDAAWATFWLARYSLGLAEGDGFFREAVRTLRGAREDVIVERTRAWFAAEVAHRLRPGARDALARHRSQGHRLVLATSSSPYASREAVRAFGLDDYVCTEFEVVDGVFTGGLTSMAYGAAKAARVAEWAEREGVSLGDCSFYTDSITDLALLEAVGAPVVVNPDRALLREAQRRGWPVVDWGAATPA
jgi:HAD superfamily hydrolase (TIGR01490 family)